MSEASDPPPPVVVRLARPSDLRRLRDVEASGEHLFRGLFGDAVAPALLARPPEGADRAVRPGFLLVAEHERQVIGFAHVLDPGEADGVAHLEQLSVRPEHGRRGVGTQLVRAVLEEARWAGYHEISLTTYRDVAWNGPFYARLGFVEVAAPRRWQRALLDREEALGLGVNGTRVVMSRPLLRT